MNHEQDRPSQTNGWLPMSRPRFWPYLLGPFLLGWTTGLPHGLAGASPTDLVRLAAGLAFFSFPANLFVYGVNDLHDEATDRLNAKKDGYEHALKPELRNILRNVAWLVPLAGLAWWLFGWSGASPFQKTEALVGFGGFFFLAWQYSAPPIRAKARPYLDSAFNALYVFPALVGHALTNAGQAFPAWQALLAGWLWCGAMHAFSAVPDIHADRSAGLETVATRLGTAGTIGICGLAFAGAGVLSAPWLGGLGYAGAAWYAGLMALAWHRRNEPSKLFELYRCFPWINVAAGFLAWAWLAVR